MTTRSDDKAVRDALTKWWNPPDFVLRQAGADMVPDGVVLCDSGKHLVNAGDVCQECHHGCSNPSPECPGKEG